MAENQLAVTSNQNSAELLTAQQACDYLQISKPTLWHKTKQGEIKAIYRKGKTKPQPFYDLADLKDYQQRRAMQIEIVPPRQAAPGRSWPAVEPEAQPEQLQLPAEPETLFISLHEAAYRSGLSLGMLKDLCAEGTIGIFHGKYYISWQALIEFSRTLRRPPAE